MGAKRCSLAAAITAAAVLAGVPIEKALGQQAELTYGAVFSTGPGVDPNECAAQSRSAARSKFYVEYTYWAQGPDGIVRRLSSGRKGPYLTRREAQSVCDHINSDDTRIRGVRYYFSARVVP